MTSSLHQWFGKKLRERHTQNFQKWMNCLKAYILDNFWLQIKSEANFREADFHLHTIFSRSVSLLRQAELNADHPLHELVPSRLPRSQALSMPLVHTSRRMDSFLPRTCCIMNASAIRTACDMWDTFFIDFSISTCFLVVQQVRNHDF